MPPDWMRKPYNPGGNSQISNQPNIQTSPKFTPPRRGPVGVLFHETNPIYTRPTLKNAKRTLNRTHAAGVPPLYLTPVFQPGASHTQKMQNEPNFTPPPTQMRKTNPISTRPPARQPKKRKTNPICPRDHSALRQKCENEPNSRTPSVQPPPISAKRTQFQHTQRPATPNFSETNPISNHQYTFDNRQYTIPWPNPPRSQISDVRCRISPCPPPIMQNKPNLPPHRPKY